MKQTDDIVDSAGEVYGYARTYIEQLLEYYKLETAERISLTLSAAITVIVIMVVGLISSIFLSLALGFYLAEILDSSTQSFLIIGGIYAFIGIIITIFRRKLLVNFILSKMIKIFFQKEQI